MRCGVYVRVSTDDQRDNGYSIDSQLRMIKEYCEKNEYDIVDVYNDAGHSGKDLMRPEMQRLLKDIKSKKIDKLVAIKVDRLTCNNYDGFWLLNYCEKHDVKIELILEPYDVSTAKNNTLFFTNIKNIGFAFLYDLLSREAKRDMIHRLISMIEIKRDKNYNIEIKDIKFTDEFITKSSKEYLKYLNNIMNDNNIGIKFHKEIDEIELKNMESNYDILSIKKMKHKEYSNKFLEEFITKSQEHLYIDGIVSCPYTEKNVIKDILILVPKKKLINTI